MDLRRPGAWGDSGNHDLGLIGVYERATATYGWTPDFIETNLTDELFFRYIRKLADREIEQAKIEEDRLTVAMATAISIYNDPTARRQWMSRRLPSVAPNKEQQAATFARLGIGPAGGRVRVH